jgi:hypothetical protein
MPCSCIAPTRRISELRPQLSTPVTARRTAPQREGGGPDDPPCTIEHIRPTPRAEAGLKPH